MNGSRVEPAPSAAVRMISTKPITHINDLSFHIEGRTLFDGASCAIPAGHKVGFVGRNGSGKTTLFRIILGEANPDTGGVSVPSTWRIGAVAQEAPGGETSLIDHVLEADKERASLMAATETESDPIQIAEIHTRLADIGAHAAPAPLPDLVGDHRSHRAWRNGASGRLFR